MTLRRQQILADWLTVGLPLAILYLATLQRDIGIIDSGELGAVCVRLGIAHPTGYPIYSLLGRVVAQWAPDGTEMASLAGLSAVAVVLACLAFVSILRGVLCAVSPTAPTSALARWAARAGGLVLGTGAVAWSQAVTNEVYGLHLLFVVLILRVGLRLILDRGSRERVLLSLAYIVGLAGGNHLSIVFLGPATVWAVGIWLLEVPARRRIPALVRAGCFALLGLSTVLYLPIRSSQDPVLDWGNPETLPEAVRHLGGMQYRVWHFQSAERFFENLTGYLTGFPGAVGWVLLPLLVWGVFVSGRRVPKLAIHLGLVAVVTLIWASGYEIFDLEPYYLPTDVVAIGFAVIGLFDLLRRLFESRPGSVIRDNAGSTQIATFRTVPAGPIVGIVCAAVVGGSSGFQVVSRYAEVDRSHDHAVRFHLETVLSTVPNGSILLSAFWDAVVSPMLYVQAVEGERTDVTVVDTELLRRSWYYPQLERGDSSLLTPLESEVGDFLSALAPFEARKRYDAGRLEAAYREVIEEIAHTHRPGRATVFTADVPASFTRGIAPVPEGLVYVLRDDPASSPELDPPDVEGLLASGIRPEDRIHAAIIDLWVRMMRTRIVYLERFGRRVEADRWSSELSKLAPYGSDGR